METTTAAIADGSLSVRANLTDANLYPGATVDVPIRASNSSSVPLTVKDFRTSTLVVTAAPGNECRNRDFEWTATATEGNSVAADARSRVGTLTVTMKESAGNGCQGATLAISLVANAQNVVPPTPGA